MKKYLKSPSVFHSITLAFALAGFATQAQERPPRPLQEPPRQRPGPWDQDIQVYRLGADGLARVVTTFERAGVATITRLPDGRLVVAHQHFPENNPAAFDKVAVRFSSDEGESWTAPHVIELTGLSEDMRFPFDPTLVALPDGRVRLYFTSLRRGRASLPAIYSAISTDAIRYVLEPGVRFEIEGRSVIDCAVALHNGTFHLYAPDNGSGGPPGTPRDDRRSGADLPQPGVGYHATSDDGLRFKRVEDVRMEGHQRWLGNAGSNGREITFYGTGNNGIWRATSADGTDWSPPVWLPRMRAADPGAVTLKDGSLLVVGTGPPRPGTPSAQRRPVPSRRPATEPID